MRRSLLALPYMAPITNVRFTFVISTICSLGAMVGLAVASTVSPHDLCVGLEKPHRLMGSNTALTVRYAPDDHTAAILDNLTALSLRSLNADLFLLGQQHPAAPLMPVRHSSGKQQEHHRRHDSSPLPLYNGTSTYDQIRWINGFGLSPTSSYSPLRPAPTAMPLHDDRGYRHPHVGHLRQARAVPMQAHIQCVVVSDSTITLHLVSSDALRTTELYGCTLGYTQQHMFKEFGLRSGSTDWPYNGIVAHAQLVQPMQYDKIPAAFPTVLPLLPAVSVTRIGIITLTHFKCPDTIYVSSCRQSICCIRSKQCSQPSAMPSHTQLQFASCATQQQMQSAEIQHAQFEQCRLQSIPTHHAKYEPLAILLDKCQRQQLHRFALQQLQQLQELASQRLASHLATATCTQQSASHQRFALRQLQQLAIQQLRWLAGQHHMQPAIQQLVQRVPSHQCAPQLLLQRASQPHMWLAPHQQIQLGQQQPAQFAQFITTQFITASQHNTQVLITGSTCSNIIVYNDDHLQCQQCAIIISAPKQHFTHAVHALAKVSNAISLRCSSHTMTQLQLLMVHNNQCQAQGGKIRG